MRLASYGLAAALLAAAQPAAAEQWFRIGGNAQAVHYVDADSIRPEGAMLRVRLYARYSSPVAGRIHASAISSEYDCAASRYRTLEYSYFGAGRESLGSEASQSIDRWRGLEPGSFDEAIQRFICARTGGTRVADPWADADEQFRSGGE